MGVIPEKHSDVPIVTAETLKNDIEELDKNFENNEKLLDNDQFDDSSSSNDECVVEESAPEDKLEGWADAMDKVLAKTGPKNAETMILAKESLPKLDPELKKQRLEKLKKVWWFE